MHSEKMYQNSTPGLVLLQTELFYNVYSFYETVPLGHWSTEIVPLRVIYYGESNITHVGTILVYSFRSMCVMQ